MTDADDDRPDFAFLFVNGELIRFTVDTFSMHFEFSTYSIQIGADFVLTRPHEPECLFRPPKQKGDIEKLWPLIGHIIVGANSGAHRFDAIELVFDDGSVIKLLPSRGFRGTLFGRSTEVLEIEDF